MILKALVVGILLSGFLTLVVEFVIRAQVNRHLAPDRRISIHDLNRFSIWLGRNGLLARHKRLYPNSALGSAFRVFWIAFFALLFAAVVYARLAAPR